MKNIKRTLTVLIALALSFSCLCATAFAADGNADGRDNSVNSISALHLYGAAPSRYDAVYEFKYKIDADLNTIGRDLIKELELRYAPVFGAGTVRFTRSYDTATHGGIFTMTTESGTYKILANPTAVSPTGADMVREIIELPRDENGVGASKEQVLAAANSAIAIASGGNLEYQFACGDAPCIGILPELFTWDECNTEYINHIQGGVFIFRKTCWCEDLQQEISVQRWVCITPRADALYAFVNYPENTIKSRCDAEMICSLSPDFTDAIPFSGNEPIQDSWFGKTLYIKNLQNDDVTSVDIPAKAVLGNAVPRFHIAGTTLELTNPEDFDTLDISLDGENWVSLRYYWTTRTTEHRTENYVFTGLEPGSFLTIYLRAGFNPGVSCIGDVVTYHGVVPGPMAANAGTGSSVSIQLPDGLCINVGP